MRISFNMIYGQAVRGMNSNLVEIMRLNEQAASQKRINRPSDDPAGMGRSLDLRTTLGRMEQYLENIDTAEGWLSLADDQLRQASDILTRLREICEQAATGTYSSDQRQMIAAEARELMQEMVGIANTEYAGYSIFAGSKTDSNAYAMGLGATVRNAEGSSLSVVQVTGAADSTVYVEFLDSGEVGLDSLRYRYTTDGGASWREGTLEAGENVLDCGTARAELAVGSTVTATSEAGEGDGSVLWLRPAAVYLGNGSDALTVTHQGASPVTADVTGVFSTGVILRVDSGGTLSGSLEYSWSVDNGQTWSTGYTTSNASFQVPGGYLTLASNGGSDLASGDLFVIRPENAAITVDIGYSSRIQINSVGKDIFGGLYMESGTGQLVAATPVEGNLLEAVGELVGYLESNDQEGAAQCLEKLEQAHKNLTVALGEIGGRENRLIFARNSVENIKATATSNLSSIEDVDITTLSTDLAKAQYAYQAVLQTSSQIMNLSLLDYL